MKIDVLGPKGTFSELAAEHYITRTNKRAEIVLCKNIPEIFDFLAQKKADCGIVPLENLLDGSVSEVLDLLYDSDIFINAEFIVEVHHCIASTSPNIKNIKRVVSIPKALAQCLGYIRKNNLDMIEKISNAYPLRLIAEKKETDLAAIGSERAAKEYKLNILERNIEDKNHNVTRFAVISRNKNKKEKGKEYKTSIVIHPTSDRPGLLYDLLKSFAERKINLTKIESRPTKIKLGDYLFYIDFEGYEEDEKVEQAIKEIEKLAKVKIFGSYERVK